jgi:hypothetical protein
MMYSILGYWRRQIIQHGCIQVDSGADIEPFDDGMQVHEKDGETIVRNRTKRHTGVRASEPIR